MPKNETSDVSYTTCARKHAKCTFALFSPVTKNNVIFK